MTQQGPIIFNGRYELKHRLGRGGMAEVFLAHDQMLDRAVAVKVLFPALATDPGFVERFRREAQSAAGLNHPNIVGVYDWGEANGTYFIVMEYVEGESLAELIHAEGRLHPDRAAEIGADIASALGFAHRNGGVIHRDVKPGNVLITREGDVKVADFGIARAISDTSDTNLTKTGSVMGTATYFSPEQARGAALDPRSDVYSLGCVIYEMLLGQPPFAGENAVAIAYKHVQEQAPPPRQLDPAIPDTLEAIVMKTLAKQADDRYPSAQDLRADLRRYLDGARIMAGPPAMMAAGDPGATGVMDPTGYMQQPTAATSPYDDPYGDQYGDPYGDEEDEEKKSKAPLIILVVLLIFLALLLIWWATSGGSDGPDELEVPDLVGTSFEEARDELQDMGLEVEPAPVSDAGALGFFDTTPEEVGEGEVLAQDPDSGEVLDEGDTVELTYWVGEDAIEIPDVSGMTRDEAETELEDAGFTLFDVSQEEDAEPHPEDDGEGEERLVIGTDPEAGEEVSPDERITLLLPAGEATVEVPNVEGQNLSDAQAALEDAGLSVGSTEEQFHNEVPDGSVIAQSPAPGSEVDEGTAVNLTISQGAESTDVSVPDVTNRDRGAAEQMLGDAGLGVNVSTVSTSNPNENNQVLQQNPAGGQTVPEGTTVTITVGEFEDDGPDPTDPPRTTVPDTTQPTFTLPTEPD